MKPQFIPDLLDWSGSFAGSASVAADANFAWAWSDGAQDIVTHDAAAHAIAGADLAAEPPVLSPDIDVVMLPATGDGDATALGQAQISDGNTPLPVSDTASIAAEGGGAAQAALPSAGHASSGLLSDALATPSIVPVAAHAPEAGFGYSDPIAAVTHLDAPIFFTGLPSALVANGGAPAAITVMPEAVHAAPDLSGGPILANLAALADLSQSPVTDASIGAHGATAAQVQQALDESGLGVNGSGIKVGVLSDSFNDLGGAALDEADGALPSAANVQVLADISSGGSDEGRAMMQIVHDIAPGSSLAFYTAFQSEQSFADGILALAAAGCKVICDDVSYYDESFFGGGVIAQAIQTVEAEGVTYITSAGNDASNAYQAAWTPISSATYDGVPLIDVENFGGSIVKNITVTASASEPVPLLLEWNQAYGAATADLVLYVFENGSYVGSATNRSVGEPTNPWTGLDLTASGTYQIVIDNLSSVSNSDPTLIKLIAAGDGLPVSISGANVGTVYGHAMTPGVIAAGAVSAADTPAFGFSTPVSESFSSSGAGSELLFNDSGTALSSPDFINPVAVSGLDDISTTVTGGLGDFYGTSAASASLAGVAALVLAANPDLSPAQVEQIMEETATPMANSAVSGAGLVNVDAAVAAAQALLVKVTIESSGSTSLDQAGNHFYFDSNTTGTGPEFTYLGAPVVAGANGTWVLIGAEQTSSGYEVAWHNTAADQYTVWNTDSSGHFVSNNIGIVSGSSAALESLETSFHQDLNGDGTIGVAATVIESSGSTSLLKMGDNFYFGSVTGPEFSYQGAPVAESAYGSWSPIGVEQTGSGYEVAWHNAGADQYTVWNTDSSGHFVSNTLGVVSGTSLTLESLETSFHQDLNGDGVIGIPTAQASSAVTIESFGSTSLVKVGDNFFFNSNGSGAFGPEFSYQGAAVAESAYGTWSPIGVEQTASGYEVAWHNAGTDQYTVWNTDSSGGFVSNAVGGVVSGTNSALESLETSFDQDLNGDGTIGVVAHSSTVVAMAVAVASGSTAHDNFVFHAALGQQPLASTEPSGTISPDELAHFTNGNQATGFWSDHPAGTTPPAHDSHAGTADSGHDDLANSISVHHAEFAHGYLLH